MPQNGTKPKRGRGRPPGALNKTTLAAAEQKALAREVIREHVKNHIPAIIEAQIANSVGINYLVVRDKNGSYVEATNEAQVKAALRSGGDAFRVYTRQPHQASAAMLLAYAADKPVEPVEMTGQDGGPVEVKWLE